MRVFDIAFFGTSLTTGHASGDWKQKAHALLQRGAKCTVRFYDLGKPGANSNWGLANVHHVVNAKPRVAVFEFVANDASTMTLAQSKANALAIIDKIRQGSPSTRIILQTMNPAIGAAAASVPQLAQYYQQYRDLAVEQKLDLIDNWPAWGTPTTTEIPDGGHPTGFAHSRVTVPNVVNKLRPLIEAA